MFRCNSRSPRPSAAAARRSRLHLEALEDRSLLTVTATLNGGALSIIGDFGDNSETLRRKLGDPGTTEVLDSFSVVGSFPTGSISSVNVALSDGNDALFVNDANGNPVPAGGLTFDGGNGLDVLQGPDSPSTWAV